ncbi:flagellar biosynthesis protein FlhF [Pseudoalteromonas ruthenica]|uniref:flagellar biosynthesis protein FlhF n=1 Tax=Pseudoalteromonas ruthenica TaxID=151081 RepID=UPI00110B7F19|nr:flagellar biosynthesis protein FlhF [Pseudoalteromonas ruthenica]TMO43837.1 flagellar biosynthesis protein FlhF [Pseudoalteromonas ruthenica]TMO51695.1 flagellar biosynthesis protein FlhF [Pseudoalteromonas ruthenica]
MKIKRFFAKDMRTALKEVKDELGVDAVIMSNKKLADGVEIVAAIDHERPAAAPKSAPQQQMQPRATEQRMVRPQTRTQRPEPQSHNGVADSLQALLERQSPKPKNAALADMFSQSGIDMSAPEEPVAQPQRRAAPANDYAPQPTLAEPTQARAAAQSMGDDLDGDGFDELHRQTNDSVQQEAMDSEEISAMRDEMSAIRQLLEHQVSGLLHQDRARRDPTRACFIERLQGMGIDTEVAEQLVRYVPDDVSRKQAWSAALDMVQKQLHTTNNEILRHGGVYALVGPTGVGKTTTVAKLAALGAQKYGADKVALITTDTYRIGAYEQLATYGRIIGCPVKQVKDANELADVLYQLRNKRLVLIDTAGMSQRDLRLSEQLNTLMRSTRVDIRSYLVLSATAQHEVLQETVRHFQKVDLSGCIFTKLDESLSLGEIISVAIQNRLPIGYLTNGQRVPEDIRVANSEKMVRKAEQLFIKRQKTQKSAAPAGRQTVASQAVGMYD